MERCVADTAAHAKFARYRILTHELGEDPAREKMLEGGPTPCVCVFPYERSGR